MSDLILLFVGAVVAGALLYDRLSEEPSPEERLRERYAAGDIDHTEFERRIAEVVDDEFQATVAELQTINGIGPSTARSLTRAFGPRDTLFEMIPMRSNVCTASAKQAETKPCELIDRLRLNWHQQSRHSSQSHDIPHNQMRELHLDFV